MSAFGRSRPIISTGLTVSQRPLSGKADIQELAPKKSPRNDRFTPEADIELTLSKGAANDPNRTCGTNGMNRIYWTDHHQSDVGVERYGYEDWCSHMCVVTNRVR